jgi:hypothetical protein
MEAHRILGTADIHTSCPRLRYVGLSIIALATLIIQPRIPTQEAAVEPVV